MLRPYIAGFAGVLFFASTCFVSTCAGAADSAPPAKSERAMSPDSAKAGGSPNPKSERAMDPAAGKPGSAPDGHSERAMAPEKK